MKTSRFIRNSKRHLWDGSPEMQGDTYVCVCFVHERDSVPGNARNSVCDKALEHVRQLLDGYSTLGTWLKFFHRAPTGDISDLSADHNRKMQTTRLAWMEDMAQWFEARGD